MSIQSDINQTIGMASALLSINPSVQEAAKKRSELRDISNQVKKSEKTREVLTGEAETLGKKFEESGKTLGKGLKRAVKDIDNGKTVSKKRLSRLENDYNNFLDNEKEMGVMYDDVSSLHKNELENASRAFDLDPTYSNYEKYKRARLESKDWDEKLGMFANMRARAIQTTEARMKKIRENYMNRYATGGSQEDETKSTLKNDYYFGGKKINDVLGQQAVEQLAKKERENGEK
jgi:hypothetical protein